MKPSASIPVGPGRCDHHSGPVLGWSCHWFWLQWVFWDEVKDQDIGPAVGLCLEEEDVPFRYYARRVASGNKYSRKRYTHYVLVHVGAAGLDADGVRCLDHTNNKECDMRRTIEFMGDESHMIPLDCCVSQLRMAQEAVTQVESRPGLPKGDASLLIEFVSHSMQDFAERRG
ncbi:hypothetical protein ACJZ2D_014166 [Fusarium nematophilum]